MSKPIHFIILFLFFLPPLCAAGTLKQVSFSEVLALPVSQPGVSLSYGDSKDQYIEGWPAASAEALSIVFVHGGCWLSEYSLEHARGMLNDLQQRGFNVWSMEYRRTGASGGGWPAALQDVQSAINALAEGQHITLTNTVLMGHSAGGHLALLAGQAYPDLRGVIGLAPIYDFVKYAQGDNSCQQAAVAFMGNDLDDAPQAYKAANPAVQPLHKASKVIAGKADAIVPIAQFDSAPEEALSVVDGAGHFDFIHPDSLAWRAVLDQIIQFDNTND